MDPAPGIAIPDAADDAEGSDPAGDPAMAPAPHADRVSMAATAKAPARLRFLFIMVQSGAPTLHCGIA
ncbi:MAG: hypothetical protein ABIN10_07190, partial [Specibacter sp.]